jgi:hypothetical protein
MIDRTLSRLLQQRLAQFPAVTLAGPRQCGKTTRARTLAKRYFNLEVPEDALYQVLNMGIGMVAIVAADNADAVLKFIRAQKHEAWLIGEVARGKGVARVA